MLAQRLLLLAVSISCGIPASSFGQTPTSRLEFTGTVMTADGNPAAGVALTFVATDRDGSRDCGSTRTGADGSFKVGINRKPTWYQLSMWAETADAVGWWMFDWQKRTAEVRLVPLKDTTTTVTDDNGNAIEGVRLLPMQIVGDLGRADGADLPEEVRKRWTLETNGSGQFSAKLPIRGMLRGQLKAGGTENIDLVFRPSKKVLVRLQELHQIRSQLAWPQGAVRPTKLSSLGELQVYGKQLAFDANGNPADENSKPSVMLRHSLKASIDQNGAVNFKLPAGEYNQSLSLAPTTPLATTTRRLQPFVVKTGADNIFEIPTVRAYAIRGRVVNAETGEPVAGAQVRSNITRNGRYLRSSSVETVADGTYLLHSLPGKVQLKIESAAGFIPSPDSGVGKIFEQRMPRREVNADTRWPDLEVDPATEFVVRVVDTNGKPVPNAQVRYAPYAHANGVFGAPSLLTDENGECAINGVAINDTLPIWARTDNAVSSGRTVVTPKELDGPVVIRISPNFGARVRCVVKTRGGEPIAGAELKFGTAYGYVTKWLPDRGLLIGGDAATATTNAEGISLSPVLWEGQSYSITASCKGYDVTEAAQFAVQRNEVQTKEFTLRPSRASQITGTVVDENGKPIPNARVVAAGKQYQDATTRSDVKGKFKLDEVAPDVRFVFADVDCFRFGGARVSSSQPVRIRLRSESAPPESIRANRIVGQDERTEAATRLINLAQSIPATPRSAARLQPLKALVRIDLERAISNAGVFDYAVRQEAAKQLATTDPRKAVEILSPSRYAIRHAVELGQQLLARDAKKHRATAGLLADLATELAEVKENPERDYAELAPLLTKLGRHEQAEKLARAAISLVGKAKNLEGRLSYDAKSVAVALAPYDYDAAVAIASRIKTDYTRTEAVASVAEAVAYKNLPKALSDVGAVSGVSIAPLIRDKTRARIAFSIADTNPEKAIEIARSCDQPENRMMALSLIAVRVAKKDEKRAWELIDEGLQAIRNRPDMFISWSNFGGGGPFAALFAARANQVNYPDMDSVIWHVRAACRLGMHAQGRERLRATITTAGVLAVTDRFAARELLKLVEHQEDQIRGSRMLDTWIRAWVQTDFQRGVAAISEQLEEDADRGKWTVRCPLTLLLESNSEEQLRIVSEQAPGLQDWLIP